MPTALIVEDEPDANRLLALLVQMRGYKTQSAFTGGEALDKVQESRPDIVFLDLMLPDTNGYEVCRALKSTRMTNGIPIVMVTARITDENRVWSYRVGANDFVTKPYTPDQIFEAMTSADCWKRSIEGPTTAGSIEINTGAEVEPFEQISRLQSLLLAHTAWDEADVLSLDRDLVSLAQNLMEWGRRRRVKKVADIHYELHPERLILRVRDVAGWFAAADLPHTQGLGLLIDAGRFDAVSASDSESEVVMTKRLPRHEEHSERS
jgi:DNA-binding response OmpR family regulator